MDHDTAPIVDDTAARGKPLVSLVVPAYNEAAVVQSNLKVLCDYMQSLEDRYDWEMVVVNDGSKDDTSILAKSFAATRTNIFVLDHVVNFGLGQALKFAFNECQGDYIVTIDMDLSYSPDHIERLVDTLRKTPRRSSLLRRTWPGALSKTFRNSAEFSALGLTSFCPLPRTVGLKH